MGIKRKAPFLDSKEVEFVDYGEIMLNRKSEEILTEWEKATNKLTEQFIKKYYGDDGLNDWFWVVDEIGGVLSVSQSFYSLDRIVEAIRYNATYDDLEEFSELEMEACDKDKPVGISFKNFVKYPNQREELLKC